VAPEQTADPSTSLRFAQDDTEFLREEHTEFWLRMTWLLSQFVLEPALRIGPMKYAHFSEEDVRCECVVGELVC